MTASSRDIVRQFWPTLARAPGQAEVEPTFRELPVNEIALPETTETPAR